jgi:hypothetical protein
VERQAQFSAATGLHATALMRKIALMLLDLQQNNTNIQTKYLNNTLGDV